MSEKSIKILYVEDDPDLFEPWFRFIRETWGDDCRGVRSREGALKLIERNGFKPDLVIFDRRILFYEGETVESEKAGDSLYRYLYKVSRDIRIVVFSGDDLEHVEPYASHKPLHFFPKPFDQADLRRAVDLYLRDRGKVARD